jgi:Rne/Rng family ribonuclease
MSGISRRLPDTERNRLKSILKNLIPDQAGVIIRTAAEGAPEAELERDVSRLKAQWEDIEKKANDSSTSAPSLLYGEPDLTVRVIRDIFNEDFNKMLVQGDQAWDDIQNYIGHIAPELASKIEKWSSNRDLFAENRVEEQLAKAFDRKVYLPSGGSLVIDRTEAMIVIDVNTGKFIGKGGNLEETVTKNNLEAAEEIARQLRLRDMGGIIVIDFIDMTLESNRELVLRRLVECLGRDRTKHQVAEVTSLGLVQMTRKRVGQGLIEAFSTTCESCGGRGIHIHSEPVKKVALEKDMEQRFAKTSKANSDDADDENDDADEDSDIEETSNSDDNQSDQKVEEIPSATTGRRKGRRAVSTGVISTN